MNKIASLTLLINLTHKIMSTDSTAWYAIRIEGGTEWMIVKVTGKATIEGYTVLGPCVSMYSAEEKSEEYDKAQKKL